MDKNEVLRRAQEKKPNKMDEMELDIYNKGCKVGLIAGPGICDLLFYGRRAINLQMEQAEKEKRFVLWYFMVRLGNRILCRLFI